MLLVWKCMWSINILQFVTYYCFVGQACKLVIDRYTDQTILSSDFCVYRHRPMQAAAFVNPALFADRRPQATRCCWRHCSEECIWVYTEFTKKRVFGQLTLADVSSARRRPAREKCQSPNATQHGGELRWTAPTLCTQTMFSMLTFMCRDPGDITSKVSCCVEPS